MSNIKAKLFDMVEKWETDKVKWGRNEVKQQIFLKLLQQTKISLWNSLKESESDAIA